MVVVVAAAAAVVVGVLHYPEGPSSQYFKDSGSPLMVFGTGVPSVVVGVGESSQGALAPRCLG